MIFRPKKNVFSLLADFHRSAKSSKKLFCARLAGRTCSYRLAWGFAGGAGHSTVGLEKQRRELDNPGSHFTYLVGAPLQESKT